MQKLAKYNMSYTETVRSPLQSTLFPQVLVNRKTFLKGNSFFLYYYVNIKLLNIYTSGPVVTLPVQNVFEPNFSP